MNFAAVGAKGQDNIKETAVLYTHYDYLELPPGASPARIEAAYQTIKQRLHGHSDDKMIRMIHEAYAVLSDPDRRHWYDDALRHAAAEADAELKRALEAGSASPPRRVQDVPAPPRAILSTCAV
jgi:curved DNA-binding protein CbpA